MLFCLEDLLHGSLLFLVKLSIYSLFQLPYFSVCNKGNSSREQSGMLDKTVATHRNSDSRQQEAFGLDRANPGGCTEERGCFFHFSHPDSDCWLAGAEVTNSWCRASLTFRPPHATNSILTASVPPPDCDLWRKP